MTFGTAVETCFSKYAVFRGRAGRPEFWWFFLLNVIVDSVASFADAIIFDSGSITVGFNLLTPDGPIATITALLLLLPNLAVGVRRLHDINRTGWWLLIGLIPCIGFIVLLVFFCTQSDPRPNRFDPVRS